MKTILNKIEMKTIIITLLILCAGITLRAQTGIGSVLASIEENNTTLKSLRESADAQKLENKTGIYLENPEVGFNYLWGNPAEIGNRTDFSVMQTFDIPTVTGMKSRMAGEKNSLIEWQYRADRMNILLEAKRYCLELIYCNALKRELTLRLQHATTIAAGYKERLDRGAAGILEYNKARLNLSTVQGEMARVDVERDALIGRLKQLNGGNDLTLDDHLFSAIDFPLSFESWYAEAGQKNPVLSYVKQEIEVSKKQLSLSRAMSLPALTAGYMSEKVTGQRYQGLSVGISIPLWENKNRVRQAKAAVRAAESRETDSQRRLYGQLQILYNRTLGLKAAADAYRNSLETANSSDLLKKALDAGEISLLDYVLEIGLYYDTVNRALEAERDYQMAYAELSAAEL
jgi:outer membrane protein TolC